MDFIIFLPILGVFVGWVLKEISSNIAIINKQKKDIGSSLYHLLVIEGEISFFLYALDDILEKPDDIEQNHSYLLSLITDSFSKETFYNKCYSTIENIADKYPVLGSKLKYNVDEHLKLREELERDINNDIESFGEFKELHEKHKERSMETKELKERHNNIMERYNKIEEIKNKFETNEAMDNYLKQLRESENDGFSKFEDVEKLNEDMSKSMLEREELYKKEFLVVVKYCRNHSIYIIGDMRKIISRLIRKHSFSAWLNYKFPSRTYDKKIRNGKEGVKL